MTPARRYTLTDECGNHVRTFQIKMIAGPIKICWQEKNRVKAILLTIRLRLDEHYFLRETQVVFGTSRHKDFRPPACAFSFSTTKRPRNSAPTITVICL